MTYSAKASDRHIHKGDIELNSQNYYVRNALMKLQTDKKGQASVNPRDISICTAEIVSFK